MTLLWAWLFYLLGKRNRTLEKTDKKTSNPEGVRTVIYSFFRGRSFVTMLVPVVILGLCYSFSANLGFNTTSGYIQKSLGGLKQTAHFDIYYDPSSITREDVELLAEDHEYRYEWLQHRLDVDVNERIESYLYPDARTMARLTGARNTNVSPVWLSTPQLHVLLASYQQVFAHELVHIFSREFGLPVLNVSFSVGLVEGLAVALEPPDGYPSPHELVSAAFFSQFHDDGTSHDRLSRQITPFLSPVGFWTGRGAVSYTTMGSFVRYLLDTYGSEVFKSVYAKSDFLIAYGKTPEQLAQAWEDSLKSIPLVSRAAADIVLRRFTIPSLFEKRCPHYIPRYRRYYRRGLEAWERRDTLCTLAMMERSLALRPQYEPALNHWSFLQNERGLHSAVLNRMETLQIEGLSPNLLVRLADTYAMLEDNERAYRLYDLAYSRTPQSDRDGHIRVILRQLLLDQPQMKQIVISGNSPEHRAEQMVSLEDTLAIGRLVQSLILAEAGRFDQAFIRLKETDLTEDIQLVAGRREALSRRRLVWLAQFAFRDGQLDNAARYASRATQAYLSVGDWNEAARLVDFIDKMNWLQIERAKRN